MNEHEIERVAAAINQLRPDWPVRSLRTLIATKLANRPRRDVTVALAWVACESGTSTPARVIEAGPWWRAAAADGSAVKFDPIPAEERCSTCRLREPQCAARQQAEPRDARHDFEPDFREPADPTAEVAHLRTLIRATAGATEPTEGDAS